MPLIGNDLETHTTPMGFTFGATRLEHLGASEYTLVTIAIDESSSVYSFKNDLENMLGVIVESCRRSPRADNLLIRALSFNDHVRELHGFKLLGDINVGDYKNVIHPNGMTALNDAMVNSVASVNQYGQNLSAGDFTANGILFVVTDGGENASTASQAIVKASIEKIRQDESLESIRTILIGVNMSDPSLLSNYKDDTGIDQFVSIADANPKSLAKIAEFVSSSISSQSQSLGTGGPSSPVSLAF